MIIWLDKCYFLWIASGVVFLSPVASSALDLDRPFTVKIGLGQSELKHSFDNLALTSKGYTVKNYQKYAVNDRSNSYGLAYTIGPKLNLDISWQSFGKVNSSVDIELPADKTAKQAAEAIVDASPQQVGGYMVAVGGNYIQPLFPRLDLRVGAGVIIGKEDHQVTINDEVFDINNDVAAPYAKLGLGAKLSRGFTLTVQAERYFISNDIERYEIGLSYDFSLTQPK